MNLKNISETHKQAIRVIQSITIKKNFRFLIANIYLLVDFLMIENPKNIKINSKNTIVNTNEFWSILPSADNSFPKTKGLHKKAKQIIT